LAKLSDPAAFLPIALFVGEIPDKLPFSVASAQGKWRLQPEFKSEYSIGRKRHPGIGPDPIRPLLAAKIAAADGHNPAGGEARFRDDAR
jgi:hypothetical protein